MTMNAEFDDFESVPQPLNSKIKFKKDEIPQVKKPRLKKQKTEREEEEEVDFNLNDRNPRKNKK
jgi:hypothetical protein